MSLCSRPSFHRRGSAPATFKRIALNASLIIVTASATRILAQAEQAAPATPALTTAPSASKLDSEDLLAEARHLYASADYEIALDMLNRIVAANPSSRERHSIDLYRIFCLVALGRTGDADTAVTAMITRDPLYQPADSEMPPRVGRMFSDKRRLVLPSIIQSRYSQAKTAFDRHEYKTAAEGFKEMLTALSDPDIADSASRPPLSDLRVLAVGFNDLAVRAMAPQPMVRPEPTTPQPVSRPEPATAPPRPPSVAALRLPTIYDSNNADVIPPVTMKQDMPQYPRSVSVQRTGVLFIVIGETGAVESAIITEPLDATYDQMVLAAAQTWTYRPAMHSGVAVKYRKRIQMTLRRQTN
jgi:hypothetical protein